VLSFRAYSALFSFEVGFRDLWISLLRSLMLRGAWLSAPQTALLELFDAILLFEWWIFISRITLSRPATPSYYSSRGFLSLESLFPGQQRRLFIRVVGFGPLNHYFHASSAILSFESWILVPPITFFRPAASLYYLSRGFRFHEMFLLDYNVSILFKACNTISLFEGAFAAGRVHSFRPLIRLKRIYNFLCSMLVYTPFSLCFVTLCGVFMHFPELTY
jgi:hypothetical protein